MSEGNKKKILVVRYHTIGDTLFTLPFFKELRNIVGEEYQIDALSNNGNEYILKNIPYIDNIVNIDNIAPLRLRNFFKWYPVIKEYSKIYFLCCDKPLSVIAFLSGVKERTGFNLPAVEYNYFLTERVDYNVNVHAANTYLSLLHLNDYETKKIEFENIFKDIPKQTKFDLGSDYVVIHPISTGRLKDWSFDKWKSVLKHITETGVNVVITGSKKDYEKAQELVLSDKIFNLCGKTTMEETISIINASKMLIGIDSGLIHLAAILKKKSILLHGSTSLAHWKPINDNCKIISKNFPCSPCSYLMTEPHRPVCDNVDCMCAISADDVINAYENLLNG